MKNKSEILDRIKNSGLSYLKLSKGTGIDNSTIGKWFKDGSNPDIGLLLIIDQYLDSIQSDDPEQFTVSEPSPNYLTERRNLKAANTPVMVPLVPVTAQAGYTKRYANTDFISSLEYYPIVPGIDPHGAIWRYFQIEGESMKDFLNSGDYVLSSQIQRDDWPDLKDALVYVIVTDELVTIKRVIKRPEKNDLVLIPDNDSFEQVAVKMDDVKEIWKYRRHIG